MLALQRNLVCDTTCLAHTLLQPCLCWHTVWQWVIHSDPLTRWLGCLSDTCCWLLGSPYSGLLGRNPVNYISWVLPHCYWCLQKLRFRRPKRDHWFMCGTDLNPTTTDFQHMFIDSLGREPRMDVWLIEQRAFLVPTVMHCALMNTQPFRATWNASL